MAGVFKSLDRSDVRLTPFRAYKQFEGSDSYTTYSAILNTRVNDGQEDIGNDAFYNAESVALTTNNKSSNTVWHSIDSQFYRYYYLNPKASFGSLIPTHQPRYLTDKALVISIPQSNFGEQIEPGSLKMVVGTRTYIDSYYGNVELSGSKWLTGAGALSGITGSQVVFSVKPSMHTYQFKKVLNETVDYGVDLLKSKVALNNVYVTSSTYETVYHLDNSAYPTSSIVITPNGEEANQSFNFQNHDYAIVLTYSGSNNCVLVQKKQTLELQKVDLNGNINNVQIIRYPYKLSIDSANKIVFEKSSGAGIVKYTSTSAYNFNSPIVLYRSGSQFGLKYNTSTTNETFTDTLYSSERYCVNKAAIYIGADENGNSGSIGSFGNISFLKNPQRPINSHAAFFYRIGQNGGGYNNPYNTVGNIFRQQGLVVITDKNLANYIETNGISSLEYRGTTTIYENEVSCTVTPGELRFTNNPTAHQYDETLDQYKLADFATGSDFSPFVTRVGLYDDRGNLVVIGSLSQPIQLPQNVDTTFIVRYDV